MSYLSLSEEGQPAFGAGGSEPYARALCDAATEVELEDALHPERARPVRVMRVDSDRLRGVS